MYDAIVLAGGGGARLGGADKPQLRVGGTSLLDRALAAVAGAERIVVVGPDQPTSVPVTFCREQPPGGGPVAAIAAGVAHTSAACVVVLAADLPGIAPAVPVLLDALPAAGMSLLLDASGRANYLAAAWRRADLVAALTALEASGGPAGKAARALAAMVAQVEVPDPEGWGRDCDTPEDLAQARARWDDHVNNTAASEDADA